MLCREKTLLWLPVPEQKAHDQVDAQKSDPKAHRCVGQVVGSQHDAGESHHSGPDKTKGHQRRLVSLQPGLQAGCPPPHCPGGREWRRRRQKTGQKGWRRRTAPRRGDNPPKNPAPPGLPSPQAPRTTCDGAERLYFPSQNVSLFSWGLAIHPGGCVPGKSFSPESKYTTKDRKNQKNAGQKTQQPRRAPVCGRRPAGCGLLAFFREGEKGKKGVYLIRGASGCSFRHRSSTRNCPRAAARSGRCRPSC